MTRHIAVLWLVLLLLSGWSRGWGERTEAAGPASPPGGALKAARASEWTPSHARHLLFRAGFGGDAAAVRELYQLGRAAAVERLVDYAAQPSWSLPPPSAAELPEPLPRMTNLSPEERQKINQERRRDDQRRMNELRVWWVQRMIESPRPVEEKMTLFWHGLFTSGYQTVRSSRAMYVQNELFRQHAVGNYGALLRAIVRDPAMLRYLDNISNVKGRPNENLAREILELFSMGEGNYSEQDIKEAARALTGYGYDRTTWEFRFTRRTHDDGTKTIFGQTGNWDGDQLVDWILQQPATARYIARKLFVFFVHDDPDEATIDGLAGLLRDSDYEVAPVLKTLFLSREFYSDRAMATHIKSPAELVVGTIRSLPPIQVDYAALAQALRSMEQDLFEPPNVKGWDGGEAWLNSNSLFVRQNFAVALINGGRVGLARSGGANRNGKKAMELASLCQRNRLHTPEEVVRFFARTLFAVPLTDDECGELMAVLGPLPPAPQWPARTAEINEQLRRLLTLMLSMPQYQVM